MNDLSQTIDERLNKHPLLRARIEAILDITERKSQGPDTADAVEERAIVEVRKLGQEVMSGWAANKAAEELALEREKHPELRTHKKKGPAGTPHLGKLK